MSGVGWSVTFLYIKKTNMVDVTIVMGPIGPVTIGFLPEDFFKNCDKVTSMAIPFIEELKRRLEQGTQEDIKAKFDTSKWNKMMEKSDDKTA